MIVGKMGVAEFRRWNMTIVNKPDIFIPYLESGDRLTRFEFERRYMAMPNLKKAELID